MAACDGRTGRQTDTQTCMRPITNSRSSVDRVKNHSYSLVRRSDTHVGLCYTLWSALQNDSHAPRCLPVCTLQQRAVGLQVALLSQRVRAMLHVCQ